MYNYMQICYWNNRLFFHWCIISKYGSCVVDQKWRRMMTYRWSYIWSLKSVQLIKRKYAINNYQNFISIQFFLSWTIYSRMTCMTQRFIFNTYKIREIYILCKKILSVLTCSWWYCLWLKCVTLCVMCNM